eukprot:CAMPEP_0113618614 /NCGR_PEP_ID=MMETSP0017_2-20120614/9431_1 /TAXON_ID=2856 /ORGANISM="Cylindrotheca closterium" /LENGTH=83 /DNA_ID=CAMNT_0000528135 /DNA_START=53 /DNA_END=301 /DNA_ORIENTATION=+ /assembly_acc=CAM_ASM_000147
MMSDNSIPVMNKPVDMMSSGVNSNNLQAAARQRHPVEELQRQQATQKVSFFGTTEEEEVRRMYGAGMAMRMATERRMAAEMGG